MNQEDFDDDQERSAGRKTVLIYLGVGALAALATGYVMTAGLPTSVKSPAKPPVVTETKPAETKPVETQTAETKPADTKPAEPVAAEQQAAAPEAKPEVKPEPSQAEATKTETQPETQTAAAEPQAAEPKSEEPAQPATETAPAQPAAQAEPAPQPAPQPEQQQAAVQPQATVEPAPAATPQPAPEPTPAPEAATPPKPMAPSFDTVRVEPTGDAVIAGRAEPGSEVIVKHNGNVIGTTVANAEGSFVFVPEKPLPSGSGALSLESLLSGAIQTSDATVAVAVKNGAKGEALVAVVKPDEPTKIIQAPSDTPATGPASSVVLDAVDYDATGNIIFSGRSKPGNTVRLYIDNALAGEVNADTDGRWMFGGQAEVAPGTHTLRADEIGADGKVLSRVELPFLREEAAKVASAEPPEVTEPAQTTVELAASANPEPAAAPAAADQAAEPAPAATAEMNVSTGETQVATTEPAATPAQAVSDRVVIQPGNNLWRLSRSVYGKGVQYTVIYEANKDQIRNPDLIYPGQVFTLPKAP
jgi:nucleoid-associated protein YgaU